MNTNESNDNNRSIYFDPLSERNIRFTRTVYSPTGVEEHPFQRLGSGTVISHEGDFFLITARHIFENNHASPKNVLITFPETGETAWQTNACIHLEAIEPFIDDSTFADLAIYSLHTPSKVRNLILDGDFLPFPSIPDFTPSIPLYAFGFPDSEFMVNPCNKHVLTMCGYEGSYLKKSPYHAMHIFHSNQLPASCNGMSGGAITYLDVTKIGRHLLAGIIVQAGHFTLNFIGADMIRNALNLCMPQLRHLSVHGPFED